MKLIDKLNDRVLRLQVKAQAARLNNERGELGPYVLGWLLGVPTSILVIIYLLKHH